MLGFANLLLVNGLATALSSQVAAGSNQLFTGSIDGVDNIFSEKL